MRATLRRLLAILDGKPTGMKGQSLVELTLTLPILMVMLMGLTEIGWYANNYLNLLDIVREAGRFGATRDPLLWSDGEELNYSRMDCEEISSVFDKLPFENNLTFPGPDLGAYPTNSAAKYGISGERPIGYYDGVACTVIGNFAPLIFDDNNDDIVISVFSYAVDPNVSPPYVRVVGRYPARANECENSDNFDPFDWNRNGSGADENEDSARWDAGFDNVRGYVFRGNHVTDYGGTDPCVGSEFTTEEIENLLNLDGNPDQARKMQQASSFGLVLVEIFWSHHQLLGLDFFSFGPIEDAQIIHVWTFFPVSAAEPPFDL